MTIQVSRAGVIADADEVDRRRAEFNEKGCVVLPRLFEPGFLSYVTDRVKQGQWGKLERDGFDSLDVLGGAAVDLVHFVGNWPGFLQLAHGITGRGPFNWFEGWIYRMVPNAGHHDEWHSDLEEGRVVAMSVNLSHEGYEGGLFQLRKRGTTQMIAEVANTGPGDALFFRISDNLLHRVTEVDGVMPKTAFAGWFHATGPTWVERLRALPPGTGNTSIESNH